MTLQIIVTCDGCGVVADGPRWPDGWYVWMGQELCHTCAVPKIKDALGARMLEDEQIPTPIWTRRP